MKEESDTLLQDPTIKACRGCLETEDNLRELNDLELVKTFSEFTGNSVFPSDGYPQYICKLCLYLLRKFVKFRHRCIKAMYLLQQLEAEVGVITTESIKKINRDEVKHNLLKHCNDLIIHITADEHLNILPAEAVNIKEETNFIECNETQENPNECLITNTDKIFDEINKISKEEIENDIYDDDLYEDDDDIPLVKRQKSCKKATQKKEPRKRKIPKQSQNTTNKKSTKRQKLENHENTLIKYDYDLETMSEACKKRIEEIKRDIADGKVKSTELQNYIEYVQKMQKLADECNISVTFLTKEEQILAMEAKRNSEQFRSEQFKCDVCCKIFNSADVLENHTASHSPSRGKYACEICLLRFNRMCYLRKHFEVRHKAKIFCKTCERKLVDWKIEDHFEWHRGNHKLFKCEQCNLQFTVRKQHLMHVINTHGGHMEGPECLLCDDGRGFASKTGLSVHINMRHKTKPNCSTCKVVFADSDALSVHVNSTGGCRTGYSSCPKCGNNFTNESEMKTHFNEVHRINYFKCNECPKKFKDTKTYERHLKNHQNKLNNDNKDGVVVDLKLGAVRVGRERMRTPRKDRYHNVICEICGVTLLHITKYRDHMRRHTGEKPFECDYCKKRFRIKTTMQLHIATHTGEKKYKCHLCPKAFTQYQHRTSHMTTHTKERPYPCPNCGKCFACKENMKEHLRTVHEGLPPRRKNRVRRAKEDVATTQWMANQIEDTI